jgi:hypothetical protein
LEIPCYLSSREIEDAHQKQANMAQISPLTYTHSAVEMAVRSASPL